MSSPPLEWKRISLDGTFQLIPRDVFSLVHLFELFVVAGITQIDLSILRIAIDNRGSHCTLIRPETEEEGGTRVPETVRAIPLCRISVVIAKHALEDIITGPTFKETHRWSFSFRHL
jgi:hypothetical protein